MNKLISILLVLCILMGLVGCGGNDTSQNVSFASSMSSAVNEAPSAQEVLDEILTKEEQQWVIDIMYGTDFSIKAGIDIWNYYFSPDACEQLYTVGLKGLPSLIYETVNFVYDETLIGDEYTPPWYQAFWCYGIVTLFHCDENSIRDIGVDPDEFEKTIYALCSSAEEECPKIISSDNTLREKLDELRFYGILAIPYVKAEVDNGNAEYEEYFTEIGLHLTSVEFMEKTNYLDGSDADEHYERIRTDPKAETFDWRVWYEENEEDLDNLFKFLDAYCAEYEAGLTE